MSCEHSLIPLIVFASIVAMFTIVSFVFVVVASKAGAFQKPNSMRIRIICTACNREYSAAGRYYV